MEINFYWFSQAFSAVFQCNSARQFFPYVPLFRNLPGNTEKRSFRSCHWCWTRVCRASVAGRSNSCVSGSPLMQPRRRRLSTCWRSSTTVHRVSAERLMTWSSTSRTRFHTKQILVRFGEIGFCAECNWIRQKRILFFYGKESLFGQIKFIFDKSLFQQARIFLLKMLSDQTRVLYQQK